MYEAIDLARFLWEAWTWSDTLRFASKLLRLPSRDPGGNDQIAHPLRRPPFGQTR